MTNTGTFGSRLDAYRRRLIGDTAISLLLHPRLLMVNEPPLGLGPRMVEIVFDAILAANPRRHDGP